MSEENKQEENRLVQLVPGRFKLAEYERSDWIVNAPEGATLDDVKKPEFWAFVAPQMRPFDHVEVRADDGTWVAQFIVTAADRTWAKIAEIYTVKLASAADEMKNSSAFDVDYKGPHKKWCIIRRSDSAMVREGIGTKDEAFKERERLEQTASAA